MKVRINPKTLLIASLVATVPAKICKKQPIKFVDNIVDTVSFVKKPIKNILVVDNFKSDVVDINGDFLSDVSHGFVTSSIIEKGLPNAKVVKCNIFPKSSVNRLFVVESLDKLFSSVLKKMDEGEKFDAINLSIGFSTRYEFLSNKIGISLNPENIIHYAKDVRKVLDESDSNTKIKRIPVKNIVRLLDKMDKITEKGTKIYVAAGNSSDKSLNLLTLANNVVSVGGTNKKGRFVVYSDRNSLVNRFENGEVCSKSVEGGFDFTGDGKFDVKKEETTALFNFATIFAKFEGTSFATPRAIVKDFSK